MWRWAEVLVHHRYGAARLRQAKPKMCVMALSSGLPASMALKPVQPHARLGNACTHYSTANLTDNFPAPGCNSHGPHATGQVLVHTRMPSLEGNPTDPGDLPWTHV